MIKFNKDSKLSAFLEFDTEGAEELITVLSKVKNNVIGTVRINGDIELKITKNEIKSSFSFNKNSSISIELDTDELDYAMERLTNCAINRGFYPAEFCELEYNKSHITIYGKYVD